MYCVGELQLEANTSVTACGSRRRDEALIIKRMNIRRNLSPSFLKRDPLFESYYWGKTDWQAQTHTWS